MNVANLILRGGQPAPVALALMLAVTAAHAIDEDECDKDSIAPTTHSSDFTVVGDTSDGIVRHEPTGLEWQRCPEGMVWIETGCDGEADEMTWRAALQHADTIDGWRLPNVKELNSIAELCRIEPAINQEVFPDTPSSSFWSATPYARNSDESWTVSFYLGSDNMRNKAYTNGLRLVRDAQ